MKILDFEMSFNYQIVKQEVSLFIDIKPYS